MEKKQAFKIVLDELSKCPLFMGQFDAINGSEHFMYGVESVMEEIAYAVDEKTYEEWSKKYLENFIKSLDKAKKL